MSRRVQTLMFTDIVGSTGRLRDLGDAAWAALLLRDLLRRASGDRRRRAAQLLDQVRQGATAIQAPDLAAQADELAARAEPSP